MNAMNVRLSIAVCTIKPALAVKMLESLMPYVTDEEVLVILDGVTYDAGGILSAYCVRDSRIRLICNRDNEGLSFSRNLAIRLAKHSYLLFFDDDVEIRSDLLTRYKALFAKNYALLGGPLKLPERMGGLPTWLPLGYSSLIGIHTMQKKIWGGNFGFDRQLCFRHKLTFQDDLGRRGGQLQSGDDTTFMEQIKAIENTRSGFFEELAVDHCVGSSRYSLKYLIRRSYWQGRSEVRRNNIQKGFVKEYERAFLCEGPDVSWRVLRLVAGLLLFSSFVVGLLLEAMLRACRMGK